MGNKEEEKICKSDKSSSPAPREQANIAVYQDWAEMQAYYAQNVALPPYYYSAVASGHAPHRYMCGKPQPMVQPYGVPNAAIYPPENVHPRPAVPLVASLLKGKTPTKSSGNTDQGLMKKLKWFDGLAMSNDNHNTRSFDQMSKSGETKGSSNGSNGNTSVVDKTKKKRSSEGTPTIGDGKGQADDSSFHPANAVSNNAMHLKVAPTTVMVQMVGTPLSSGTTTTLENEQELKREKRKQSNRESARRSKLRKQAETEEIANKVEALTVENIALKSEINRLTDGSEKMKLENATLMEKLK